MTRMAWLKTPWLKDVEKKLKEPFREYLMRKHFDDGLRPSDIRRDLISKGVEISPGMMYYYLNRVESELRKGR